MTGKSISNVASPEIPSKLETLGVLLQVFFFQHFHQASELLIPLGVK